METERKYLNADFAALRDHLTALGASTKGPHFESNTVYDTPDLKLFRDGQLLRLRLREWPVEEQALLTFKSRPENMPANFKAREELELVIGDSIAMAAILERLGFQPCARYEKLRESWSLTLVGCRYSVELDATPIGDIVEVEGDPLMMDNVAHALALDKCEISLKTYHELNQEWRKAQRIAKSADILFDADDRKRMRALAGLPA